MEYEKKYKEALERMKSWARGEHPECFAEAQKAAEFIFPELAESEDEKKGKKLFQHSNMLIIKVCMTNILLGLKSKVNRNLL